MREQQQAYLNYFRYDANDPDQKDDILRMGDIVWLSKDQYNGSTEAEAIIKEHPGYTFSGTVLPGLPIFELSPKYANDFGVDFWHIAETLDAGFSISRQNELENEAVEEGIV